MPSIPRYLDALPRQHGVEPAAAAGPARIGAEFIAALADPRPDLVMQLGRERSPADPASYTL